MADNKVKFLRGTSNEYAVAEKDSDTIYFTTDDGKLYIGDKEISGDGSLTIDNTLSDTSTNPVQNKIVKQAIDNKADKTTATTTDDGLMSAEDKSKLDNADNTYALKSKYGDTAISVGRKAGSEVGEYSTAEGMNTIASGAQSHAEGAGTTAGGSNSHAEGSSTKANGNYSHAEGFGTIANNSAESACGKFNISSSDTLFSIGNGTSNNARHNAFEITTTGGKLHDKDIATTDLIPTSLPANGGNADTVDGIHADAFFQKSFSIERSSVFTGIPTITDDENGLWIYREFINKSTDASTTAKYWRLYCPNGSKYSDIRATATDAGVDWNITGTAASHILKVNNKKVLTEGESYGKQESGVTGTLTDGIAQSVGLSFTPLAVLIFDLHNFPILTGFTLSREKNQFTIKPSSVSAMGTNVVRYIAFGG